MTLPALEHAALLVVDVQHGFCSPDGSMARSGGDHRACAAVIATVVRLLDGWRASGRPVVLTRYALAPDGADAGLLGARSPQLRIPGALVDGSADAELVAGLEPPEDELVLAKTRFSAFHATGLAAYLRRRCVDTVVVCGVTTNVCVESTVRDAFARDFHVVVPYDACASTHPVLHDASLRTIALCMGEVTSVDTILQQLAPTRLRGAA